jgi:hypothetical protein
MLLVFFSGSVKNPVSTLLNAKTVLEPIRLDCEKRRRARREAKEHGELTESFSEKLRCPNRVARMALRI